MNTLQEMPVNVKKFREWKESELFVCHEDTEGLILTQNQGRNNRSANAKSQVGTLREWVRGIKDGNGDCRIDQAEDLATRMQP